MIRMPVPDTQSLVVFTDLDGTLIDHHSYDAAGSRAALNALGARKVPLVFCSSKTFAEQSWLQIQLGINQPFIFENGSAVAIPSGFFSENTYTASRHENGYDIVVFAHADTAFLSGVLSEIPGIKGYAGVTDAELAQVTGLSGDALSRARDRWFTETLVSALSAKQASELGQLLKTADLTLSRGGRFYTLQSAEVNKGLAVRWMMDVFTKNAPQTPVSAAVGDSLNDAPMLEVVDAPFLVQGPDRSWAKIDIPGLRKIVGVGPAGFSAMVEQLLGS